MSFASPVSPAPVTASAVATLVERAREQGQVSVEDMRTAFATADYSPQDAKRVLRELAEAGVTVGTAGSTGSTGSTGTAAKTRTTTSRSTAQRTAKAHSDAHPGVHTEEGTATTTTKRRSTARRSTPETTVVLADAAAPTELSEVVPAPEGAALEVPAEPTTATAAAPAADSTGTAPTAETAESPEGDDARMLELLEPFRTKRQLPGLNATDVQIPGLLWRLGFVGQQVVGVGAQRRDRQGLPGKRHPGSRGGSLPGVVHHLLRLREGVIVTGPSDRGQEALDGLPIGRDRDH